MRKSLIFAMSVVTALVLKADVMNWRVADENLIGYDAAKLYYVNSNTTIGGTELASMELDEGFGDPMPIDLASYNSISEASTYFYIEVGNYSDTNFQASQRMGAYSYSDLVSAGMISKGGVDLPTGSMFGVAGADIKGGPSGFSPVPEPGTATLILLGMAIAGLKRRRV